MKQIYNVSHTYFPYTTEQILSLADSEHFGRSSRNLAVAFRWQHLARSADFIWGAFPQKDKAFFTVVVQLGNLRSRCSCTNQAYPCQHALALLLLFTENRNAFSEAELPKELEFKQTFSLAVSRNMSTEELDDIRAGLSTFETWLHDMLRSGLESARAYPLLHWQQLSDRLFDARLGLLAEDVRRWGQAANKDDWPELLLEKMGLAQLLIEGFKRFESLTKEVQADLLLAVGRWPEFADFIEDSWFVLGRQKVQVGTRKLERVWLRGRESKRFALLEQQLSKSGLRDTQLLTGTVFLGKLAFYEGSYQMPARLVELKEMSAATDFGVAPASLKEALASVAELRSRNPWQRVHPLMLHGVRVIQREDDWFIQDAEGFVLPLPKKLASRWHLRALSFEAGLSLFAEWKGEQLYPLSVWAQGRLFDLKLAKGGVL